MRHRWRVILTLCCLIVATSANADSSQVKGGEKTQAARTSDEAVSLAMGWLLRNQSDDGRWCSETYGVMRSGVGTTALILEALSEVKPVSGSPAEEAFRKGLSALTAHLSESGLVRAPDGRSDSPVYGTALVLTASERFHPLPEPVKKRLIEGLLRSQQIPANAWPENAVGRGGWGVEPDPATAESNPANLSVTRHVLQALERTPSLTPAARQEAVAFLNRCRNPQFRPDGGFWFLPRWEDHLNKGGWLKNEQGMLQPRSYSTATCDGLLTLRRLSFPLDGPDVQSALAALRSQPAVAVPRVPADSDELIPPLAGLYYYHAAALGNVWSETRDLSLKPRGDAVRQELLGLQHSDGHWENPVAWMREDDPLIATALAVLALKRFERPE